MQDKSSISEAGKSFFDEIASTVKIDSYGQAFGKLNAQATELNSTFRENRTRITEMTTTISNVLPNITRLGGDLSDVGNTIGDIADASRRNVIANEEVIEGIFVASKVLRTDAATLSNAFINVGVGIENIRDTVEDSVNYVQSIGLNAEKVFGKVLNNTEQLSRFNFEDGVRGFTKMAAQAHLLRFDMNESFRLADDVMNPERAVQVASAFQRLGVAAGNLVDPFQLMNASIMDPSGLQDSLIKVGKQFTYFDEKTKSFKISPQGIMTLKEIQAQTGVSAEELRKAALASAELDARLSEISPSIKFENEEDKQYLANIARMGKGGKYEIAIGMDKEGQQVYKELSQVTQEEMKSLIEKQREAPKTLEDIQRNSLTLTELIQVDVRALAEKIVYGAVSAPTLVKFSEDVRGVAGAIGGTLSQGDRYFGVQNVRRESEKFFSNASDILGKIVAGEASFETFNEYLSKNAEQIKSIGSGFASEIERFVGEVAEKIPEGKDKPISSFAKEQAEKLNTWLTGEKGKLKSELDKKELLRSSFISESIATEKMEVAKTKAATAAASNKVDVNGTVKIELVLPAGFNNLTPAQQEKLIDSIIADKKFTNQVQNIIGQKDGKPATNTLTTIPKSP